MPRVSSAITLSSELIFDYLDEKSSGALYGHLNPGEYGHGLGKHNFEEQKGFAIRDFKALSDVLESSDYLVGDRMTVFDFSVASLLAGLIDNKPATWLSEIAQKYPALRTYAERIQGEVGVYARAGI